MSRFAHIKRHLLGSHLLLLAPLLVLSAPAAFASPSYRSFIEWNGPYYHVRHALGADSVYLNHTVNNPLPLYSLPFSSPNGVALFGSSETPSAFVIDHEHSRIQVFSAPVNWSVEILVYSSAPVQSNFGSRSIKFNYGHVLSASESILINGQRFTRVSSLTGYTATDSVYTIIYDGPPNTGGVVTLPQGWNLGNRDSVRVEYAFADSNGSDVDYVLYQSAPSPVPLQLNETSSSTDPRMNDLTSLALNTSVRSGSVADLYLINALPDHAGTLASYDLSSVGQGGQFHHVDTYPGVLGRPYAVAVVDRGANTPGVAALGRATGVADDRLTFAVHNPNTYPGHDYRLTYSFDTTSAMNQSATPDNQESDLAFDPVSGRLHMVFCSDNAALGTAYSYSDDYGQTWSRAVTVSPATLTGFHDRPRVAIRSTGEIHVVYEAVNTIGERHLYHTASTDGISWTETWEVTTGLTPAVVTENRYANVLVDPQTDDLHLIWAGDDDVYHCVYSGMWSVPQQIAEGNGGGFSAPHAVVDSSGRIYLAYVSYAFPPCQISYMSWNGSAWGSYDGGTFAENTADAVTFASGFADNGGGRGEVFPFPQIALTGDSVWIFWMGQGTEYYGSDFCQVYCNRINTRAGDFDPASATAITTNDHCAPLRFTVSADAAGNLHVVYPYGTLVNSEGLRYKIWKRAAGTWTPGESTTGRNIFNAGADASVYAFEPRLITPMIAGQVVPMLVCARSHFNIGSGTARILFKIIDGVIAVTDDTDLAQFNRFHVWTTGVADSGLVPGLAFTIRNSSDGISNTDNVSATEYNLGDTFEIRGTPPVKNDLLFVTDADSHRVKIINANDNADGCFGGEERWDIPGKSDGSPSQTYKLATTGGEGTIRVWAGPDSTAWSIVNDLQITGPGSHVCELNRYTRELRFGDGTHGAIPPSGALIRVHYQESADEAEFGRIGSGSGQMSAPHGIAARYNTSLGQYDVYICDSGNHGLQKWAYRPDSNLDPASWSSPVVSWNTAAGDTDLLGTPEAVQVVMLHNQVYLVVSDNGNARLVIYRDDEASGNGGNTPPAFVSTIGSQGTCLNEFLDPRGLAVTTEDSGLVVFAADAGRNEVCKIVLRDWLEAGTADTSGGTNSSSLLLSLTDVLDGDANLLVQPRAERTIELRVAHCDSLMGLHVYTTFPATMMDVVSITEGNLWSGEQYTNKVFLYDYDNTTGRLQINASMVGDVDGLTTAASRVVATIVVRADSGMTIPSAGVVTLTDSTDLRRGNNQRITGYGRTNLNVLGGYLADIAATGGDTGTAPHMAPSPDGKIDFADINAFTQGWNGDGLVSDPLADIGPFTGDTPPQLIACPDGKMDAYDLLSLSTMYNWYHATHPLILPPSGKGAHALDEDSPVFAVVQRANHRWSVELRVRNIPALTTAHLTVQVANPSASIASVHQGGFLGTDHTVFLHTESGAAADICLGRLNRESPCANGTGVLAIVELITPEGVTPEVHVLYELRDQHYTIVASGETESTGELALDFSLSAPYPNPFNSVTTFTLNLNESGQATIEIFNLLGQQVATLMDQSVPAGIHRLTWNARSQSGTALPSGIYIARLETRSRTAVQKIILLR